MLACELRALEALRGSPYIIRLLGADVDSSSLLLELAPHGDLERVLHCAMDASLPVPLTLKISWAMDMAEALAHAHQHHILHLDIKPTNVLLFSNPKFRAKLADFDVSAPPLHAGVVGTRGFMSPEMKLRREVTAASDTYSWSAFFYALLIGHDPYGDLSSKMEQEAQAARLPEWFVNMLRACSDAEPEPRWDMKGVSHALLTYLCRDSDGDPRVRTSHPDHPAVLELERYLESRCVDRDGDPDVDRSSGQMASAETLPVAVCVSAARVVAAQPVEEAAAADAIRTAIMVPMRRAAGESVQCRRGNGRGGRCKKMTMNASGYCHLHV